MNNNTEKVYCPSCFGVSLPEKKCSTCGDSGFVTYRQLELFFLEENNIVKRLIPKKAKEINE